LQLLDGARLSLKGGLGSCLQTVSLHQGFFTDEDTNLVKKFTLYVEDNWNKCDMVAIFLFIIGVTCRSVVSEAL
jgi:hypothetical protein